MVPASATLSPAAHDVEPSHGSVKATATKRLTYFLLLRTSVAVLLMLMAFASELEHPAGITPQAVVLFTLIGLTFGITLLGALLVRRERGLSWLASALAATDLVLISVVVTITGGAYSGFVFLYLLLIVGASVMSGGRGVTLVTLGCCVSYLGVGLGLRFGWIPGLASAMEGTLSTTLRSIGANLVAFVATALLSRRLAHELERAGERIVDQRTRLHALEALYADVVESLGSGLLTVSGTGIVTSLNRTGAELLGVSVGSVVGRPIGEVVPKLPELIAQSPVRRGEVDVDDSDGAERCFGVSISPLKGEQGRVGQVISFLDLTELKRMREQVQRTEQLAAIGRLAAGVAHEVRNPLAAISGAAELLRSTVTLDEESKELMDIVTNEVTRLDRLVAEMLDFARPHPPEPSAVDLGSALRDFRRAVSMDKKFDHVTFELVMEEQVVVEADPGQLRQVLWNLVRNAADVAPEGTAITLSLSTLSRSDRRYACIGVCDRGPGIAPQDREYLFEPFFSRKKSGTGLGLSIVHRIVEQHQGEIEVREPGDGQGGTEFVIRLPMPSLPK